jgi:hypothetical protein
MMVTTLIRRRRGMKSYDELKAEMKNIKQQIVQAKKSKRTVVLKKIKEPCKELDFTAVMLEGALSEERNKN